MSGDRRMQEGERLFEEGKLIEAYELLKDLEASDNPIWEEIMEAQRHLDAFKQDVEDTTGFQQVQKGHLQMWYKHVKGQPVHCVRFATELDTCPSHVVAVAREFDLIKKWDWMGKGFVQDTVVIGSTRKFEVDVLARLWLPWPFKNRQILLHACGVDRLREEGKMYILFKTTHQNDVAMRLQRDDVDETTRVEGLNLLDKYAKDEDKYEHALVELSGVEISPVAFNKLNVRATLRADPKIGSVATPLVEFFLKIFFPFAFKLIVKQLYKITKEESPYRRRIVSRPYLYQVIDKHTKEMLGLAEREQE